MKRQKMRLSDLSEFGIWYHASQRIALPGNISGTRFVLDKPLTDDQIKAIAQYKNVVRRNVAYRQAPEIRYETLILTDKILPARA